MAGKAFACLALLLLLAVSAQAQLGQYCIADDINGFTADDFFDAPADVNLATCTDSSGRSCCTSAYADLITTNDDTMGLLFKQTLQNMPTECAFALEGLSCIMCSPEQAYYAQKDKDNNGLLYVCADLCDSIFESCSGAYTEYSGEMATAANTFADGSDFCNALFEPSDTLSIYVSSFSDNCWDNLPECHLSDYYMMFTECVDDSRDRLWFKKEDSMCSGGVPVPPNEYGLECAIACDPGYAIVSSHGDPVCEECASGSFSLGGGVRNEIWDNWSSLHISFSTYCTIKNAYGATHIYTEDDCGWELRGEEVDSGDINNNMASILETSVTLVADGALTVSFYVSAENHYDGLIIYVDHSIVQAIESDVPDYITRSYPLTAGYHLIQFAYTKDSSVSRGLDQAFINMVEISNVRYADYSCTSCSAGQHQPATGQDHCFDCPANFYSTTGSADCAQCPAGTFSYEGSSECIDEDPCTDEDKVYLYGECEEDGQGGIHRSYGPVWLEPHSCNEDSGVELEEPVWVPCLDCNPGMYRVGADCIPCASGSASNGLDDCEVCPAGTEATRYEYFYYFDSWNFLNSRGLTTECNSNCGSDGWELHDTYIDSGEGHGDGVQSKLILETELLEAGKLSFKFSFDCEGRCDLRVYAGSNSKHYWGGAWVGSPIIDQAVSIDVAAGTDRIEFIFGKDDFENVYRSDKVRINTMSISNDADGGAPACFDCDAGFFAPTGGVEACTIADPGYYVAEAGSQTQTMCPDNEYSTEPGATECKSCGENTGTNTAHTECVIDCIYTTDAGETFDMTAMARSDSEMYGPIFDVSNNEYYLNACTMQHSNHTCFDGRGQPIDTYACQVAPNGSGQDLGDVFGYLPLRDSYPEGTVGLTLHYTHGDDCINRTSMEYFPRESFVDVICAPSAGINEPAPFDVTSNIETSQCVYEFVWYSLYGCPLCTEDNYYYLVTECVDNRRTIQYNWVEDEEGYKMCHDGVTLPPSIEVDCSISDYVCPEGSFVDLTDPSTAANPQCQDAEPGYYSIGGGAVYDSWTHLPDGFSTVGWDGSMEAYIASGVDTTSLMYINSWLTDGYLEFSYKVYSFGDSFAGLSVFVDGSEIGSLRTYTGADYVTERVTVAAGAHSALFQFVAGTATTYEERERGARIEWIKAVGLTTAAEFQLPCPPGTYQDEYGKSSCKLCPFNTYSYGAADQCTECHHEQYAYPGSAECHQREPCVDSDYQETYSTCNDGSVTTTITLIWPEICIETEERAGTVVREDVECTCPPGHYLSEEGGWSCEVCAPGFFYSDDECLPSVAGNAALLKTGWFNGPEAGTTLPEGFTKGCSGDCNGGGWRFMVDHVDSNVNYADEDIDSWLELDVENTHAGSVTFTYAVSGHEDNGLEVFVNGVQVGASYHPSGSRAARGTASISLDLEEGMNNIRWNYHQERGTRGLVELSSIVVVGAAAGGATEDSPCPPGSASESSKQSTCMTCPEGTQSSGTGSTSCSVCGPNFIAEEDGSDLCTECGKLTQSNEDHTDCEASCIFYYGNFNRTIDVTPLQNVPGPYPLPSTEGEVSLLLNLCNKRTSDFYCIDPYGDPISTYACEVDSRGNGVDSGHVLDIELLDMPDKNSTVAPDIVFEYTSGSKEECKGGRTTKVTLTCDASKVNSIPAETEDSTLCHPDLVWATIFACGVCEDSDYEERISACEDGEQSRTVVRVNDYCNGPAVLSQSTNSCHDFELQFGLAIIITLAVVGAALLIVAGFIGWRYRMLHHRYVALVGSTEEGYEMEEVDNDLAEEKETAAEKEA